MLAGPVRSQPEVLHMLAAHMAAAHQELALLGHRTSAAAASHTQAVELGIHILPRLVLASLRMVRRRVALLLLLHLLPRQTHTPVPHTRVSSSRLQPALGLLVVVRRTRHSENTVRRLRGRRLGKEAAVWPS